MCEHDIDRELTDSRPQQPVVVVRLSAAVVTLNQISSFRTIPLVPARTDSPLEYELLDTIFPLMLLHYYPLLGHTLSDRNLSEQHFHFVPPSSFHSLHHTYLHRNTITLGISSSRTLPPPRWGYFVAFNIFVYMYFYVSIYPGATLFLLLLVLLLPNSHKSTLDQLPHWKKSNTHLGV